MVTTAATPMTTPSTVRKARVRFRRISRSAMMKAFQNIDIMASGPSRGGFRS
jgi:hypothetical protein